MYRVFLVALLIALGGATAHAQFSTSDTLSLSMSPENPRPYDTVTVTPSSSLIDLIASTVTVSVNGTVVERGTGAQTIPVKVGGPGERTTIQVTATTGGQSYSTSVTLHPADVALIVEPITTTHPFYQGAALVGSESRVRLIAIPDLRSSPASRLASSDLIYTWKVGDQILEGSSGIGKSVLIASAPVRYRDAQVSVTVTNAAGTLVASHSTTISPVDPIARIYRDDPLMGPDFDHAQSGSYHMTGAEEAFRAVAYYFGVEPSLAWAINDQVASNASDVTVRTTGSGRGTASVSLTASDSSGTQTALSNLSVSFGDQVTNIFGF